MKSYQDWCVETIYSVLKNKSCYSGSLDDYGYKVIIKHIIRHYPEVFVVNNTHMHFWTNQVTQSVVTTFRNSLMHSFIFSERAYAIAMDGCIEDFRNHLYQEHITPVQYVFNRLKAIPKAILSIESVKACMKDNKLVLLHKDESRHLDQGGFTNADLDLLKKVGATPSEYEEAHTLVGRSSKSCGFGLFRMCKLANSGIEFQDGQGRFIPAGRWSDCLTCDILS